MRPRCRSILRRPFWDMKRRGPPHLANRPQRHRDTALDQPQRHEDTENSASMHWPHIRAKDLSGVARQLLVTKTRVPTVVVTRRLSEASLLDHGMGNSDRPERPSC